MQMHCSGELTLSDQRNSLCYKCDVAQLSTLLECSNELSAHLVVVRHLDVTQKPYKDQDTFI